MTTLMYNFVSSDDIDADIYIGSQGSFKAPRRVVSKTSIPGRNGDLIRDEGRFANILLTYNIVIMDDVRRTAPLIYDWLLSPGSGYHRLDDMNYDWHFRMARVEGEIEFKTGPYNKTGVAQVTFDCKPQKYLYSGERPYSIDTATTLTNPTKYPSNPEIKVFGDGTCALMLNDQLITIDDVDEYVVLDSETMNAYKGTTNMNSKVHLGTNGFPVFVPGENTIQPGTNVTEVQYKGRWWEL